MKNSISLAFLSALLLTPAYAAPVIDVATLKCSDFEKMSPAAAGAVMSWIDGYMGGRAEDTRMDVDRLQQNADAAQKICNTDPSQGILSVLKDVEAKNAK
jgi:hypothetical protein